VTGCLWLILTALGLATTRHGAQLNGIAQLGFLISTCLAIASGAYERPLARLRARHQRTELPYEVDWDGFDRARADWDPIQPE
jgi:hypothetical protein